MRTSTNPVIDEENVEDLEDFQNTGRTSIVGPRPIVRCYEVNKGKNSIKTIFQLNPLQQQTDQSGTVDQLISPLQQKGISVEDIDRNVDYPGWLEMKKRKWKDSREKRKRRRYPILICIERFITVAMSIFLFL